MKAQVIQGNGTMRAVYSPANRGWLILWGNEDVSKAALLTIKDTREAAIEFMTECKALPYTEEVSK